MSSRQSVLLTLLQAHATTNSKGRASTLPVNDYVKMFRNMSKAWKAWQNDMSVAPELSQVPLLDLLLNSKLTSLPRTHLQALSHILHQLIWEGTVP